MENKKSLIKILVSLIKIVDLYEKKFIFKLIIKFRKKETGNNFYTHN